MSEISISQNEQDKPNKVMIRLANLPYYKLTGWRAVDKEQVLTPENMEILEFKLEEQEALKLRDVLNRYFGNRSVA